MQGDYFLVDLVIDFQLPLTHLTRKEAMAH